MLAWLVSRGISPVASSSGSRAHLAENLAKVKNGVRAAAFSADSGGGGDGGSAARRLSAALAVAAENAEMIDMYGGADEYAAAFKRMGQGEQGTGLASS